MKVWPAASEPNAVPGGRAGARGKLAIVLPGLGAGGTEHVVNMLANAWAVEGWQVEVVTFDLPGSSPYYRFHPEVRIRQLGIPPAKRSAASAAVAGLRRIAVLRRVLREIGPDLILSFLTRTNVMTLLAARGTGVPVVVSERNNPARQDVGPVWGWLRSRLYGKAFGLVAMTRGALDYFPERMRRRSWVIPNAVDLPTGGERRRGGNRLVAVGRLVPQKGFDLLLRAFALIAADEPQWSLVVWGEGPERPILEALRDSLGMRDRVEFPGVTAEPGIWVDTADAFVLSSRFEGWGIVLLEAMAARLPVVSFDCRWGPREMITDGVDGLLVPPEDVPELARALKRLLSDERLRDRLASAAEETARAFTPESVVGRWDDVVNAALEAAPARR